MRWYRGLRLLLDGVFHLLGIAMKDPGPEPEVQVPLSGTCRWCKQEMYTAQEYCSHCQRHRFTGKPRS